MFNHRAIHDSMNLGNVNSGFHHRWLIASKDGQVNDRLAIASLIRGSQSQCRSSYAINFFEDVNMIFQFFSASRHLGFEDIQAMVNLISDPRQIYGLPIGSSLDNLAIYLVLQLHNVCILSCNPLASPCFTRQGVETQSILRCNEASSLTSNEVFFYRFPVYVQGFRHIPSLDTIVHKVNASLNQGIKASVHQLSSVNIHPPLPFPYRDRGRGTSVRIGIVRRNPKGQPLQKGKTK